MKETYNYPEKVGNINIYPEIVEGNVVTISVIGNPEGLKYLADMKKLNLLYIRGTWDRSKQEFNSGGNFTNEGLRQLEGLKLLTLLEIYAENTFSDAALRRLQRELPNSFRLRINGGILLRIDGE